MAKPFNLQEGPGILRQADNALYSSARFYTELNCTLFYTSLHCTMHLTMHSFTLKLCNATIDLKHSALFFTALNCFHETALYNKEIMPPLERDNLLSRHVTQYSVQAAGFSVHQAVLLCSVHYTVYNVQFEV